MNNFDANRFELEESIMQAWQTSNDIHLVWTQYMDGEQSMSEDELCNILLGLEQLTHRRFCALMAVFERCISSEKSE